MSTTRNCPLQDIKIDWPAKLYLLKWTISRGTHRKRSKASPLVVGKLYANDKMHGHRESQARNSSTILNEYCLCATIFFCTAGCDDDVYWFLDLPPTCKAPMQWNEIPIQKQKHSSMAAEESLYTG
jgi:hypothetical protein